MPKLLSPEEERDLVVKAKAGDKRALEALLGAFSPLIEKQGRKFIADKIEYEDLLQEGRMGFCRAIEKYDFDKNNKLGVYANFWIRAYMLKYVKDYWSIVKGLPYK